MGSWKILRRKSGHSHHFYFTYCILVAQPYIPHTARIPKGNWSIQRTGAISRPPLGLPSFINSNDWKIHTANHLSINHIQNVKSCEMHYAQETKFNRSLYPIAYAILPLGRLKFLHNSLSKHDTWHHYIPLLLLGQAYTHAYIKHIWAPCQILSLYAFHEVVLKQTSYYPNAQANIQMVLNLKTAPAVELPFIGNLFYPASQWENSCISITKPYLLHL